MRAVRRTIIAAAGLGFALPAGMAVASTDTTTVTTEVTETTEVTGTTTMDASATTAAGADTTSAGTVEATSGTEAPAAGGALGQVYDDDNNLVATITLDSAEVNWMGYKEDEGPDDDQQYVRVMVTVTSTVTDGTFDVNVDDFIMQDVFGRVDVGESKESTDDVAASIDVTSEAKLANGESVELPIVFAIGSDSAPQSVYYRPDEDKLVTVGDVTS